MSALIIQADARGLPIETGSVDLIVTSPPYFGLRSYTDKGEEYAGQIGTEETPKDYIDALIECTREWMRVIKRTGSIWVNLGDKYNAYNGNRGDGNLQKNAIRQTVAPRSGLDVKDIKQKSLIGLPWRYALRCVDDLGLILREEVIWSKPNGLPESVRDRTRRSHESWMHFTQHPRYYADLTELRIPSVTGEIDRIPGSVWDIPVSSLRVPKSIGTGHYATFPTEWPRRIITGWCPPEGIVLDPFGGTGTTAMVADVMGRTGISVDASADYCRIAQWRVNDPRERGKVR